MAKTKSNARFGKLPPMYKFILNPYDDVRFTTCPGCNRKTKQRKLPLVIHVDPHHLIALNKTCRYCPSCDILIAHQDEIEALLAAMFSQRDPSVIGNNYLMIGTVERKAWREGVKQPEMADEMRAFMHDFKEYRKVTVEPARRVPSDQPVEKRRLTEDDSRHP